MSLKNWVSTGSRLTWRSEVRRYQIRSSRPVNEPKRVSSRAACNETIEFPRERAGQEKFSRRPIYGHTVYVGPKFPEKVTRKAAIGSPFSCSRFVCLIPRLWDCIPVRRNRLRNVTGSLSGDRRNFLVRWNSDASKSFEFFFHSMEQYY